MKNFTNNFKQFTSRLSARWLIMALMLLVGTSSAWAKYTIYYVNVNGWANPYCYAWILNGSNEAAWPGTQMTKTDEKCLGYDVYKYDGTNDSSNRCIFSNKGSNKTGDLIINKGKYYYNGTWYSSISEIEEAATLPFLMGTLTDWDKGVKMTLSSSSNVYTCTVNLTSSSTNYEFKIKYQDKWYGNTGVITSTISGWVFAENVGNNCQLKANKDGDYTFTFNTSDKKVSVTFPPDCIAEKDVTPGEVNVKPANDKYCAGEDYQLSINPTAIGGYTTTIQWQKKDGNNYSNVGSNSTLLNLENLVAGTYTYRATVTWTKGTCTVTESTEDKSFTVNALPNAPGLENSASSQCVTANGTVNLNTLASPVGTVYWYDSSSQLISNATVSIATAGTFTYTAKAVSNGCESTSGTSFELTVKYNANASNYSIKAGSESKDYTGSELGLTKDEIVVSNNAGTVSTIYFKQNGSNVTPINVGDYEVYVTTAATDDICAGDIKIGTFTINKANQIDNFAITNDQTTYCGLPSEAITLTATGGSTNETVTYESGDKTVATISGSKLTVLKEGSVTIKATRPGGTNYNDITATKEFTFYKAPDAPTVKSVTNLIKCGDNTTDGLITLNNYNSNYTYSISPVAGGDANEGYKIPKQDNYTITVTRKMNETCSLSTSSATIPVGLTDNTPAATVTISGHNDACRGKNTELTCNITNKKGELVSYQWYKGDAPIENANSEKLTIENITEDATYYVEVTLENEGCTKPLDKVSYDVTVVETPNAPVFESESKSVCSGVNFTLPTPTNLGEKEFVVWSIQNAGPTIISQKLTETTTYIALIQNEDGCTSDVTEFTVDVTTTPVITPSSTITTINKEVKLTSAAGANTSWSYDGGSLDKEVGAEVNFSASANGTYHITSTNTENNISCTSTATIKVQDSFYIIIRRPKSGDSDNVYTEWYEKSNEDQKGGAPWFEEGEAGSDIGTNDAEGKNDPNYGGYPPVESFEDCDGYIWDIFIPENFVANYKFHIHAPNGAGADGYATFTQTTTITSMTGDKYYKINKWSGGKTLGTTLSEVTTVPQRVPNVTQPTLSMESIICSGTSTNVQVTNPENGITYTLSYNGEVEGEPIPYNGSGDVTFSVNKAGKYMVKAETTEGTCKGSASSRGVDLKVLTSTISFSQEEYITTPWVPITIVVNTPQGYTYTYDDSQLIGITPEEHKPIKGTSGNEYTYTFPRPWDAGNSTSGDGWGEKTYQVKATITGAPDACNSVTATVKLQDEGNDKCTTTNP